MGRRWILATGAGLLLLLSTTLSYAVDIDLRQSNGTTQKLGGDGALAKFTLATCLSGESDCVGTSPSSYIMTVGGVMRRTVAATGIVVGTQGTSATFTLPSGGKTPHAKVEGTGAVTQTWTLFGAYDTTAANGKLLCTITLSGTTKDVDGCDGTTQFTQDWPYYYVTSASTSGTGATGELVVDVGIAGGPSSVLLDTLLSGEDQTNNLLMTSGGVVRTTTFSSVTSATSSTITSVPTGPKTFMGQIINATSETKAVTALIYGNWTSSTTGGILLCTLTLPSTVTVLQLQDACPVVTANFKFYYYTVSAYTSASSAPFTVYAMY